MMSTTKINLTIPETIDQAEVLAAALHAELSQMWDDPEGACQIASGAIKAIFGDDAVIFSGTIPGDWEQSGYHFICSVGDFFIDLTIGQFFNLDFLAFSEDDRSIMGQWHEFGGFQEVSEEFEKDLSRPFKALAARIRAEN